MPLKQLILLLFSVTTLLSACQSPTPKALKQTKPAPNRDFKSLEIDQPMTAKIYSLGCGIGCPIYTVAIQSDFSATYKGLAFVRNTSEHQFLMTPTSRKSWLELLQTMKQQTRINSNIAGCENYRTDSLRYKITIEQMDKSYERILDKGCNTNLATRFEGFSNELVKRWISRRGQSKIK